MRYFDTVLDFLFGTSRERELSDRVEYLSAENVKLRRQLQAIRVAHEPLHTAIFPPKIEGKPPDSRSDSQGFGARSASPYLTTLNF